MAIKTKTTADGIKVFVIDFRDQNGRRVREKAGTCLTDAKRLLKKRMGQVIDGTYINPTEKVRLDREAKALELLRKEQEERVKKEGSFSAFRARFLRDYDGKRGKLRSRHYESHSKPLAEFFGEKPIADITPADLDAFRAKRANEVGPSTVRKNLIVAGTIFKKAVRWRVINASPAVELDKPNDPDARDRYLTPEEWDRLAESAPEWLLPMFTLSVALGLRLGEVVTLEWKNVDLREGFLTVSENTKTGPRPLPISETARSILSERDKVRDIRTGRHRSAFVFTDEEANDYTSVRTRNIITKETIRAMKAAGIENASFASFRHTAAQWMHDGSKDLGAVSLDAVGAVLGHKDTKMTKRYARTRPVHLRAAVGVIDAVLVSPRPKPDGLVLDSRPTDEAPSEPADMQPASTTSAVAVRSPLPRP